MGEESDQIAIEIEQQRAELGSNLQELKGRIRETVTWQGRVRRNPFAVLGISFGAGILAALAWNRFGASR